MYSNSTRNFGRYRLLVFAGLLSSLSCLYLFVDSEHPPGTFFPHMAHTGDEPDNESCLNCHKGVDKNETIHKSFIPAKNSCRECHEKPAETAKVKLRPRTGSIIYFSHKQHMEKNKKLLCVNCHKKVVTNKYLPVRGGFPEMDDCKSCHADWLPNAKQPENAHRNQCVVCHKTKIMPRNHYFNWGKIHRVEASGQFQSDCASCHADKSGCTDCHQGGRFRPESHDLTWVQTHRFNVRNTIGNCKSCHTTDSCQDCHRAQGVSGTPGFSRKYGLNPHPPGWMRDMPGTGRHHGNSARFKLESCKSCHVKNDCSICHVRRFRFGR